MGSPSKEQLQSALIWRSLALGMFETARASLADALDACPKPTLERVQAKRALRALDDARDTCASNINAGHKLLGEES